MYYSVSVQIGATLLQLVHYYNWYAITTGTLSQIIKYYVGCTVTPDTLLQLIHHYNWYTVTMATNIISLAMMYYRGQIYNLYDFRLDFGIVSTVWYALFWNCFDSLVCFVFQTVETIPNQKIPDCRNNPKTKHTRLSKQFQNKTYQTVETIPKQSIPDCRNNYKTKHTILSNQNWPINQ
jgi:hypothetical protein